MSVAFKIRTPLGERVLQLPHDGAEGLFAMVYDQIHPRANLKLTGDEMPLPILDQGSKLWRSSADAAETLAIPWASSMSGL